MSFLCSEALKIYAHSAPLKIYFSHNFPQFYFDCSPFILNLDSSWSEEGYITHIWDMVGICIKLFHSTQITGGTKIRGRIYSCTYVTASSWVIGEGKHLKEKLLQIYSLWKDQLQSYLPLALLWGHFRSFSALNSDIILKCVTFLLLLG